MTSMPARWRPAALGTTPSRELCDAQMAAATHGVDTSDPAQLSEADFIIIAMPTPVDEAHVPDFKPLIGAGASVGLHMKRLMCVEC